MADEDNKDRVDRELGELLEELRVAIPGAEVLFAFLLGVAFTQRFAELTALQRNVYFATLVTTAAATALLIAPTAYHRWNFRAGEREKERMLFTSTYLARFSLLLIAAAVAGAVYLVGDVIYESDFGALVGAAMAVWFLWFWFGLPLMRRARSRNSSDANEPAAVPGVRQPGSRPA